MDVLVLLVPFAEHGFRSRALVARPNDFCAWERQCYGIGVIIENGNESVEIGFRELDIDSYDDYTLTFVP